MDGKDCYEVKTVPVIKKMNLNSAYLTGGQNLVIEGYGFDNATTIDIKADGVDCKLKQVTKTTIHCTVGEKAAASALSSNFVGQKGVRRKFFQKDATTIPTLASFNTLTGGVDLLQMDTAAPADISDNYGNWIRYWFVPPVTGKYRFYLSCDDLC